MNLQYRLSELLLTNKIYNSKKRNVKRKNALIGRGVNVIAFNLESIHIPYVLQDIKNNNYFY